MILILAASSLGSWLPTVSLLHSAGSYALLNVGAGSIGHWLELILIPERVESDLGSNRTVQIRSRINLW